MIKDYAETLLGGRHCSMIIRRGVCLKLTDLSGGSNVGMLMYNLENPTERLNIPDSLKCQHTFKITQGNCLYSDMGRIFCSVVADDAGWHDATSGTCNEALLQNKPWSKDSYQQALNDFVRNGYDSFAIELGKYGLDTRDLVANMNWFSRVNADDSGHLVLAEPYAPGTSVSLRFEMDTIVLMHTCPHPFNDSPTYPKTEVGIHLCVAPEVAADDQCRTSCAENGRGFTNTELYYLGR